MGISRFHKNLLNWIKNDYCEKQYKISSSSLWDRLSVIDGARVNRYMIFDDYGTFLIAIRSSLRDSRRDRFLSVSKANNWDVHNRWLAPTPPRLSDRYYRQPQLDGGCLNDSIAPHPAAVLYLLFFYIPRAIPLLIRTKVLTTWA